MHKILLVEDHPANLSVYRTILEHNGYTVVEAEDGVVALRNSEPPALERLGRGDGR